MRLPLRHRRADPEDDARPEQDALRPGMRDLILSFDARERRRRARQRPKTGRRRGDAQP